MIIGNAILIGGGSGGTGTSGYTFEDGVLHFWGARGSHLLETKLITEAGEYAARDDGIEGYSVVKVDMSLRLERLVATVNGTYLPSAGHEGFSEVVVANPEDGRCQRAEPIGLFDLQSVIAGMSWPTTAA